MEVPLYFADFSKNLSTVPKKCGLPALMGLQFDALPDNSGAARLLIVDDSRLPKEPDRAGRSAQEIAVFAQRAGCENLLLDFVRPVQSFCLRFAEQLRALLPEASFTVPPAYAHALPQATVLLSASTIYNVWASFCKQAAAQYPQGWALELIPWSVSVFKGAPSAEEAVLSPQALCMLRGSRGSYEIFDTAQTLLLRLQCAAQYGCRFGVGLNQELGSYFAQAERETARMEGVGTHG